MGSESKWLAPEGAVWVCGACGKTSRNRIDGDENSRGWDASCFLNAMLCSDASLIREHGRVVSAEALPVTTQEAQP